MEVENALPNDISKTLSITLSVICSVGVHLFLSSFGAAFDTKAVSEFTQ